MDEIQNMFVSKKWKRIPALEQLSLDALNEAITEAWLQLEPHVSYDPKEFLNMTLFIKANVSYDPKYLLRDMFFSGNWSPHKSILRLPFEEINNMALSIMIDLFNEKIIFDENQFSNMVLFIKSHRIDEDKAPVSDVPSTCNIG